MSDEKHRERFDRESSQWTGPRLFALLAGSLGVALVVLWLLADWSQKHFPP